MNVSPESSITTRSSALTVASSLAHGPTSAKAAATATKTPGPPSGSSAASNSSNITANDFLTLLVSELKNQDPTQPTDPNAYISQLVGVNSLQQLISINSGLTTIETPSNSTAGSSPTPVSASSTG